MEAPGTVTDKVLFRNKQKWKTALQHVRATKTREGTLRPGKLADREASCGGQTVRLRGWLVSLYLLIYKTGVKCSKALSSSDLPRFYLFIHSSSQSHVRTTPVLIFTASGSTPSLEG